MKINPSELIPAPELVQPGWYQDVPEDVYHSWEFASNHRLNLFERSPAHMKYADANPKDESKALLFGRAFHAAVLEPALFPVKFAAAPDVDRRTKEGKEAYAAFVAEAAGKTVLSADDYVKVEAMARSVLAHPTASVLIAQATDSEVSAVWECHKTGVMCKARADLCSEEFGAICDLKSTEDASFRAFTRDIQNYRYYRQGSMYLRGANGIGKHFKEYAIIAVEKSEPHFVAVYRITPEYLELGDKELDALLERYAECEHTGCWPSYPEDLQDVNAPAWLVKQDERRSMYE